MANGEVPEWPNGHDWKSCGQQCPAGSNPALSAIGHFPFARSANGAHYPHRRQAIRQSLLTPMIDDQELQYWIAFSRIPTIGTVRFGLIEGRFG